MAFDCDVLRPGELSVFMPEPGGPTLSEAEELLRGIVGRCDLAGLGLTGLREDADVDGARSGLPAAAGL